MDDEPPPPELVRAFDYQAWGVNVMELPPGELRSVSLARNLYHALNGWHHAKERSKWQEQNAEAWQKVVSPVIAARIARLKAQNK